MAVKRMRMLLFISVIIAAMVVTGIFLNIRRNRGEIRNVVLISIDTCRADHLGCYGFAGGITPAIDGVANEGTLFENAFTPVPMTLPSHSSIMTGTIPPAHGVHNNFQHLADSNVTLAEVLRDKGYATGAVTGAFVLDRQFGIAQGFETYVDGLKAAPGFVAYSERSGDVVSEKASRWIDENKSGKFFLFLHYFEPHTPYEPIEPYKSRFKASAYAGEVASVDHHIGAVIDKLKSLGLYDSTLIVIAGDHGEMLGEHGEDTHGYFVYQGAVRVPLIIKVPGGEKGRRVKEAVSLVDIMPTVLSLTGQAAAEHVQGHDLSGYCTGQAMEPTERFIYCESTTPTEYGCNPLLAIIDWPMKYIYSTEDELYDCVADAGEVNNLVEAEKKTGQRLVKYMKDILDENLLKGQSTDGAALDQSSIDRLHSLGYVGSESQASFELDESKGDAKDAIKFHTDKERLMDLIAGGEYERARTLCAEMIEERGDISFLYGLAGRIATLRKDMAEAVMYYEKLLEFRPDDVRARDNLATAMFQSDRIEDSIEQWQIALKTDVDFYDGHVNLAAAYYGRGRIDLAVAHWLEAVRVEPDKADILNNLAWTLAAAKDEKIRDAEKALGFAKRACDATDNRIAVYLDTLSVAYAANGQFAQAIATAEKAMSIASARQNTGLRKKLERRIALYRQNKPWLD